MKTLSEITKIAQTKAQELRDRFKVAKLYVYGSYARGEQTEESDLDMLVEYAEAVNLFDVIDTEHYLSDLCGVKVDLVLKRSVHRAIRDKVEREAVEVISYEKDKTG
jgi:uncharacterized protein